MQLSPKATDAFRRTIKKLRGLEQSRMARVTTRHTVRRERLLKFVKDLDVAAKAEFAELAKIQAEELRARAGDLEDILAGEDLDDEESPSKP